MLDPRRVFDFGPIGGPEAARDLVALGTGYGVVRGVCCGILGLGSSVDNTVAASKLNMDPARFRETRTWISEKYGERAYTILGRLQTDFSSLLGVSMGSPDDRLRWLVAALLYGGPADQASSGTNALSRRYSFEAANILVKLFMENPGAIDPNAPLSALAAIWTKVAGDSIPPPIYLAGVSDAQRRAGLEVMVEELRRAGATAESEKAALRAQLRDKEAQCAAERTLSAELLSAEIAARRASDIKAAETKSRLRLSEAKGQELQMDVLILKREVERMRTEARELERQNSSDASTIGNVERLKKEVLILNRRLEAFGADISVVTGIVDNVEIYVKHRPNKAGDAQTRPEIPRGPGDHTDPPPVSLGITTRAKLGVIVQFMNGTAKEDGAYVLCPTCAVTICCVCYEKTSKCPCCRAEFQ
jgi:hypothetical protein